MSATARTCGYCGCILTRPPRPGEVAAHTSVTRQHILPRWRGGGDQAENLRPCCHGCNQLLEAAADCPALIACARAIIDKRWPRATAKHRRIRGVLRQWVPLHTKNRLKQMGLTQEMRV